MPRPRIYLDRLFDDNDDHPTYSTATTSANLDVDRLLDRVWSLPLSEHTEDPACLVGDYDLKALLGQRSHDAE